MERDLYLTWLHLSFLGNSIEKIAIEKAGIIKSKVPVVIGETQPETVEVFVSKASETASRLFFADTSFRCTLLNWETPYCERKYTVNDLTENRLIYGSTPLGGDYQQRNIQTVFQVFNVLGKDFNISESGIIDGIREVIKNTGLQGRWQIIGKRNPLIVCDTGHNKEGVEYVIQQIKKINAAKLHIVIGFVNEQGYQFNTSCLSSKCTLLLYKGSCTERPWMKRFFKQKLPDMVLKGNVILM